MTKRHNAAKQNKASLASPLTSPFYLLSSNKTVIFKRVKLRLGKVRGWGLYLQHYSLWLIVLLTPKGVPSFISRDAAHQRRTATSASEGRNYRWNLANNPVIHVSC
jgi:hypothetical protein